jgi:hypothetical protein
MFGFFKSLFGSGASSSDPSPSETKTPPPQQPSKANETVPAQTTHRELTASKPNATNKEPEETKARPAFKPPVCEATPLQSSKKHEDDRVTADIAFLMNKIGLMREFPSPATFVERWNRLDDLLRQHGVPTSDLESALNLLALYRGSESRNERKGKIVAWAAELEKDDGNEELYCLGKDTVFGSSSKLYGWGVVRLRDVIARNLKERASRDTATLKPGTIASSPLELLEFNSKLLASQANQLMERHKDIDLNDPSVQTLGFDDLRAYLENRSKAPVKRQGAALVDIVAKSVKASQEQAAPQAKKSEVPAVQAAAKNSRACRKLSLNCLQLWISRELPCKFCKKKIIDPCTQCNQDIAASSSSLFYQCGHFVHKSCVAASHIQQNRCPQCLKASKSPPTQLN